MGSAFWSGYGGYYDDVDYDDVDYDDVDCDDYF